jgi:hypothetical protein
MNTKIKKYLLQVVAAAAFMLLPLASAHAATICNTGPIQSLPAGGGWGPESPCSCGTGNIQGGLLASSNTFGWLWSSGPSTGQVWVQLEMKLVQGSDAGFWWGERTAGGYYFVNGGGGLAESMVTQYPDYAWTGRYRSVCAQ